MNISKLRHLALSKQGLKTQNFGSGLSGTLSVIEHLGYVQIDTLSVVERAHHHVLWNRVTFYEQSHLNQLISKQNIFEYWYHAASYLPMRDYRYALPNMISIKNNDNRYFKNIDQHLMNEILARVKAEGPLKSRDFDKGSKGKGKWWNWGPTKRAIEKLFMQGDLMVCERQGMEKVYDLAERCLPSDIDISVPTLDEYATYLFDTTLRAHGVFTLKQLLHLKTGKAIRDAMYKVLNERLENEEVTEFDKETLATIYVATNLLETTANTFTNTVKILSPFDNAVIHRERLNELFGFNYKIECYVPAAKRQFGYFSLPILFGNKFVARIDCKAHRAEQRFEVLNLHFEDIEFDRDLFLPAFKNEIQNFAHFNQCPFLDESINQYL